MTKEEVKSFVRGQVLGNKAGVRSYILADKLSQCNAVIRNWSGAIEIPANAPLEEFWFVYIDHMPNANFEHPVEYVFINDQTREVRTVRGTSPPDNFSSLEPI